MEIDSLKTLVETNIPDNNTRVINAQKFREVFEGTGTDDGVVDAFNKGKADIDGYYTRMSSGLAENLISPDGQSNQEKYIFRTTAGDTSISSGSATIETLKGNSIVWNQLVQDPSVSSTSIWSTNNSYSVTYSGDIKVFTIENGYYKNAIIAHGSVISGHKYLVKLRCRIATGVGQIKLFSNIVSQVTSDSLIVFDRIITSTTTDSSFELVAAFGVNTNQFVFEVDTKHGISIYDLTLMFGSGNEPSTAAEFEALFPYDYYDYNAGTLLSFKADTLRTVGRNAYNPNTGVTAKMVGGNKYMLEGTYTSYSYTDINGNGEDLDMDSEGIFTPTNDGYLTVNGGNDTDTYVHLVWSGGMNGVYTKYSEHELSLPIRQIVDSNGDILFPDGLRSAGSAYDTVTNTKATKKVGSYTFTGNETWILPTGTGTLICKNILSGCGSTGSGILCTYTTDIALVNGTSYPEGVRITTTLSATELQSAISGHTVFYELATPVEVDFSETPQSFGTSLNLTYSADDWGTEEVLVAGSGLKVQTAPISHDTFYMTNLRDKLRNLSGSTDAGALMNPSLQNFITSLGSALGYTITKTWDSTNKCWTFSIASAY